MSNKRIYFTVDEIGSTTCEKCCRETSINWLMTEPKATLSTSDPKTITKMKKVMRKSPEAYVCYSYEGNIDKATGNYYTYFFEFDKKLLSFRTPNQNPRKPMSEEQRKAASERFKKMWAERGNNLEDLTEEDIEDMLDEEDEDEIGIMEGLCLGRGDDLFIDKEQE